ncbi:hypothetical protein [Halosolutus halophilus]|uniref:hypothetical protein n=1 Tax=Halosolutus halophilus TaxID=1552990 RepID=UPI0022350149|nr:hypothetical protein [Halosolutus halophilus]
MSDDITTERAEMFPLEIRQAVGAFEKENAKAVIATLLEEGPKSFTELKDELELYSQQLTNALDPLKTSGMIRKRAADADEDEYEAYYEISEFGSRFVHCLFESLGSVDSFDMKGEPYEKVENYQDRRTGEDLIVEGYHLRPVSDTESEEAPLPK